MTTCWTRLKVASCSLYAPACDVALAGAANAGSAATVIGTRKRRQCAHVAPAALVDEAEEAPPRGGAAPVGGATPGMQYSA